MAIETATYLSDLNISNPPGSDPVGQADDHIRLLKSVLKATFPNVTGPVNSTQAQLNYGVVPTGAIIMWSGATTSIPTGWALCNGGSYAKTDGSGTVTVPDLRDKFIVGAGLNYSAAATGGVSGITTNVAISNADTTLTTAQIPAHNHGIWVSDPGHAHSVYDPGHAHTYTAGGAAGFGYQPGYAAANSSNPYGAGTGGAGTGIGIYSAGTNISAGSNNTGGGGSHTHNNTLTQSTHDTRPPYYALAFIYKL